MEKRRYLPMKRALLVVDVQNEYFSGLLPIMHPQGHLTNILRVMDAAARDMPLVVIQQLFHSLTSRSFSAAHHSGNYTRRCRRVRTIS